MTFTPLVLIHQSVTDFSFAPALQSNDWSVAIVCAILLLLSLLIVPYRRKLSLSSRSLFSQRYFSLLFRECKILEEPVYYLALFGDFLIFGFGLLVLLEHYMPAYVNKITYMGAFGLMFGTVLLVFLIQTLVHFIYGKLFEHTKEIVALMSYRYMFLTDAAVILLPFLIVVQFTGNFPILYAYIPIFIVLFVFLVYKTMKINPGKINLFQFFIYFCTLEILPYVLLVKISTML